MASSENLIEPWAFRPSLDSWFADYIARDAETLTKALQKSISGATAPPLEDAISPFVGVAKPDAAATPTVSGISGSSDQESGLRRRGSAVPAATGRVSKRKSRASKRSQTTFITADPANFRQMVQQVTGVRFGGGGGVGEVAMAPVLKPEPQRLGCGGGFAGGRLPAAAAGCLLPTLDTSAFLLDHHQQQVVGPNSTSSGPGPLPFAPPVGLVDGSPSLGSADFDTFSSFPTLESWKVM